MAAFFTQEDFVIQCLHKTKTSYNLAILTWGLTMQVLAAGLTDIGKKRKTNQDAIYLNLDKNFFIVADGMGGHNGGDIASAMAVKCIPEYLTEHYLEDPIQIMRNCIRYANAAIHKKAKHDLKLEGMGTTSVAPLQA